MHLIKIMNVKTSVKIFALKIKSLVLKIDISDETKPLHILGELRIENKLY